MPEIGPLRSAAPTASTATPTPTSVANPASCRTCRAPERWWNSYREVLLSTETLASLIGFALLAGGWVMAATGSGLGRWFYLAAAVATGLPILGSCVESLRERRISVEVLVALAVVTSLAVGEFHAGAVVAVMLLGGGVLEQITVARAGRSLAALLVNMPATAMVRRGDQAVEVSVSDLRVGDRVITR